MKHILLVLCLGLSGCQGMDSDWLQRFYNNTTEDIYILINQRREGIYVYPDYGELPENLANRGEGNSVSYNYIQGSGWEPPYIIYYTRLCFSSRHSRKIYMGRDTRRQKILVSRNGMSRYRHSIPRRIRVYGDNRINYPTPIFTRIASDHGRTLFVRAFRYGGSPA